MNRSRLPRRVMLMALVGGGAIGAMSGLAQGQFGGFGPNTVGSSFFTNYVRDNILAVDLNDDGFDDLVTWGAGSRKLSVRLNNGTSPVSFSSTHYNPTENGDLVVSGDFNSDGFLDLCGRFTNGSGFKSVRVYFGDGTGVMTQGPDQSLVFGSSGSELFVDDIDQDGDDDLLYFYDSNLRVAALYNDGNGDFSSQEVIISESYSAFYGAAVADVDGDNVNEIVVATQGSDRAVRVFDRPDTASSYTEVFTTPPGVINSQGSHITTGDIDGDGDIDLAVSSVVNSANSVQILVNDGTGAFSVADGYDGHNLIEIHLANIDGDADLDLVIVKSEGPRSIIVRLNDGTGVFGPQLDFDVDNTSANFTSMALPDLDGNGSPDLAYRQPGRFVFAINLTPILAPGSFALGIPADGTADLALPEHILGWQVNQQPRFTWATPTGFSVAYDLSVSTTGTSPAVVYAAAGIDGTSHDVPLGVLDAGTEYEWMVTAVNPIGPMPADAAHLFTTAAGPRVCEADLSDDGIVDLTDVTAFIDAFLAGCD